MSRDEIERLDERGMAAWKGHDAQGFADLFADESTVNDVGMPAPITTRDGVREYAQGWFTAFPDMSVKQANRVGATSGSRLRCSSPGRTRVR